eukprot:697473-Rhodomonas_salina.1
MLAAVLFMVTYAADIVDKGDASAEHLAKQPTSAIDIKVRQGTERITGIRGSCEESTMTRMMHREAR